MKNKENESQGMDEKQVPRDTDFQNRKSTIKQN
jgi:hypothetical protein